jgi:hypothetical protein
VKFPAEGWKLLSLQDRELGSPSFLLATISQNPRAIYPWPSEKDDFGEMKAKILLSCGFVPAIEEPPYAKMADLLSSPQVKNSHYNQL